MDIFVTDAEDSNAEALAAEERRPTGDAAEAAAAAAAAEVEAATAEASKTASGAAGRGKGAAGGSALAPPPPAPPPTHAQQPAQPSPCAHPPPSLPHPPPPPALVSPLVLQPRIAALCHAATPVVAAAGESGPRKRSYCLPPVSVSDDLQPVQYAQNALQQRPKIPRPPNAFMLFANEWRKKLAMQYPSESNKDISVRLGGMWKSLEKDSKEQYFALARQVDAEHKRKYPDYVYNPKEARLRKALREQTRENRSSLSRAHSAALMHQQQHHAAAAAQRAGHAQPASAQVSPHAQQAAGGAWARAAAGPFAGAAPAGVARGLRPGPKAMMERSMEEMRSKIREQVEHGLVTNYPEAMVEYEPVPSYSVSQMGMPAGGDYAVVSDIDNQAWYSFAQTSQHAGSSYVMRHGDDKLQSANWNIHYATDGHGQQGTPYVMRHQMVSSSGPFTGVNQSILQSTASQNMNRSNPNQQQYQMFTPLPATINQQNNSINQKRDVNDDEQIRLMNNIPSSSSNESTSTTVTAHQKTIMRNSNNTAVTNSVPHKQTENISNKKQNVPPALSPSTTTADTNVNSDSASESRPLPTFEQAFGSTEIGRYSHEGIFNSSQHNPQDHGSQNSENKTLAGKSNGPTDAMANTSFFNSPCDEYQHGFAPFVLSSPSGKLESSDSLLPQSGWPSMFYYTPAAIPFPAAFFDYTLLPGVPTAADFIPSGPEETVLLDVPNVPGVYNRSDFQLSCNGEGSAIYTTENAFRECEEGLGYVTLHIPASTMQTINATSMQPQQGNRFDLAKQDLYSDNRAGRKSPIIVKPDSSVDESTLNEDESKMDESDNHKEELKNEGFHEKSDELKRQNLTITGMPMQEPIVISQNERICVIMDAPTPDTDYSSF